MFILCLDISPVPVIESLDESDVADNDDDGPNGDNEPCEHEAAAQHRNDEFLVEQMLHGQGSKLNGANRWYDKTMQVSLH